MKRDNLAYLLGGLAFGFVLGYGLFQTLADRPQAQAQGASREGASIPGPAGPMAPTQVGPAGAASAGGAPMLEEVNALRGVLQNDPNNVLALTRLGNLYQDVSLWQQATTFYERALASTPEDANLLTDLGVCYRGLGEYEKALAMFERAQKADPSHWQSVFNMAIVAGFNLERYGEAEAALRKLEKLNPSLPQIEQLRQALAQARGRSGGS